MSPVNSRLLFQVINIGTSVGTDVNNLVRQIHQRCQTLVSASGAAGLAAPPATCAPGRHGELQSSLVSWSRVRNVPGREPSVSLEDGPDETLSACAEQLLLRPQQSGTFEQDS